VKRAAIAIAVLAALGATGARLLRGAGPRHAGVATYTVARQRFVRRVTAEGNLRAVKATRLTAPRTGGGRMGPLKIAWLLPDGTQVKAGDVVVRFDPSDPEKQLRDGQADLESASTKLREENVKSSAAVAGRNTDAQLASDELDQTRKLTAKDSTIFSRNQIIESEIDEHLAAAKQTHAERAKQIELRLARSNAAVIGVERQKAELAVSHAQTALQAMAITAPTDGIFVIQRDWRGAMPKLGDSLWPGQTVAEIPELEAMEASVYVLEIDGSGLAEHQKADVVIEARPDRVFHGQIRLVDKLAQPRQMGSPVQYFGVTIQLGTTEREIMKPGQRVRATLVLDQEDALVVPREAVLDRDKQTVVYRLAAAGFEPVPVELGPASSGRVVITHGLSAGDVIALRDPTAAPGQAGSGSGRAAAERAP
jgi:multidrug efflux pump subunit AcrA (membrane-fusion protein)